MRADAAKPLGRVASRGRALGCGPFPGRLCSRRSHGRFCVRRRTLRRVRIRHGQYEHYNRDRPQRFHRFRSSRCAVSQRGSGSHRFAPIAYTRGGDVKKQIPTTKDGAGTWRRQVVQPSERGMPVIRNVGDESKDVDATRAGEPKL